MAIKSILWVLYRTLKKENSPLAVVLIPLKTTPHKTTLSDLPVVLCIFFLLGHLNAYFLFDVTEYTVQWQAA